MSLRPAFNLSTVMLASALSIASGAVGYTIGKNSHDTDRVLTQNQPSSETISQLEKYIQTGNIELLEKEAEQGEYPSELSDEQLAVLLNQAPNRETTDAILKVFHVESDELAEAGRRFNSRTLSFLKDNPLFDQNAINTTLIEKAALSLDGPINDAIPFLLRNFPVDEQAKREALMKTSLSMDSNTFDVIVVSLDETPDLAFWKGYQRQFNINRVIVAAGRYPMLRETAEIERKIGTLIENLEAEEEHPPPAV